MLVGALHQTKGAETARRFAVVTILEQWPVGFITAFDFSHTLNFLPTPEKERRKNAEREKWSSGPKKRKGQRNEDTFIFCKQETPFL